MPWSLVKIDADVLLAMRPHIAGHVNGAPTALSGAENKRLGVLDRQCRQPPAKSSPCTASTFESPWRYLYGIDGSCNGVVGSVLSGGHVADVGLPASRVAAAL